MQLRRTGWGSFDRARALHNAREMRRQGAMFRPREQWPLYVLQITETPRGRHYRVVEVVI